MATNDSASAAPALTPAAQVPWPSPWLSAKVFNSSVTDLITAFVNKEKTAEETWEIFKIRAVR